ncbi:hypothetical protein LSTR_LSTR016922 [Laodelphax striatellus]|uniref:Uncharacterized protein n=1 Tax=Laodelphax striatellus TaxID=195883 RepID=A0A482XPQ1_LAOST|nr:hypothetical protein LSTR_LSTR005065 [Laodelphax striatellus]RZF47604.1 hypothetical protein LSTR_LSTR016922 [Laodelphax striatellus]
MEVVYNAMKCQKGALGRLNGGHLLPEVFEYSSPSFVVVGRSSEGARAPFPVLYDSFSSTVSSPGSFRELAVKRTRTKFTHCSWSSGPAQLSRIELVDALI